MDKDGTCLSASSPSFPRCNAVCQPLARRTACPVCLRGNPFHPPIYDSFPVLAKQAVRRHDIGIYGNINRSDIVRFKLPAIACPEVKVRFGQLHQCFPSGFPHRIFTELLQNICLFVVDGFLYPSLQSVDSFHNLLILTVDCFPFIRDFPSRPKGCDFLCLHKAGRCDKSKERVPYHDKSVCVEQILTAKERLIFVNRKRTARLAGSDRP